MPDSWPGQPGSDISGLPAQVAKKIQVNPDLRARSARKNKDISGLPGADSQMQIKEMEAFGTSATNRFLSQML